ncbi:MAG: Flp pilus assembly protein CpaB [Acetobacteraceae bacterium]|nr:Flp pilus assembly protein CpaB [Acetobacteraceae bacterium]
MTRLMRLVLIPVFLGLAALGVVWRLAPAQGPRAPAAEAVQVVVASRTIPARTRIEVDMLALKSVPRELTSAGAVSRKEDAVGKVAATTLLQGEILLKDRLAGADGLFGLAYAVPPGLRAITVGVNEVAGVAGHLHAGDRVDVLATFTKEVAGEEKTVLILEDLPVLACTGALEGGSRPSKGAVGVQPSSEVKAPTSVTLAVTPEEGAVLALADERGTIRLMLRPAVREKDLGPVEVTTAAFRTQAASLASYEYKSQIRLKLTLAEVDPGSLGSLGPGARPGVSAVLEVPDAVAEALDGLASRGLARVVDRADLIAMNREFVSYRLEGEYPYRAGPEGQEVTTWQDYGLEVQVRPEAYDQPFIDLELWLGLRVLGAAPRPHAPAQELALSGLDAPLGRLHSAQAVVRVDLHEAVLVTGLFRPEPTKDGAAQAGLHVLPPPYASRELERGETELVLVIVPEADPR